MTTKTIAAKDVKPGDELYNLHGNAPAYKWVRVTKVSFEDPWTVIESTSWKTYKHPEEGVLVRITNPDFRKDTMNRFVTPKVYHIGYTAINREGLYAYLQDSGNTDFVAAMDQARGQGLSDAEVLCSFYAKLCYRALALGKNTNLTRTRDVWDNLVATFDSAHGSVFEHVQFNFVVDQCSRVFTHEHVRHRIGIAHSQTSGRYCRYDFIPLVWDPLLDPVKGLWEDHLKATEDLLYLTECSLGLRVPPPRQPEWYDHYQCEAEDCIRWRYPHPDNRHADFGVHDVEQTRWVPNDKMPFAEKKKLTSACRRIIPQGIVNEMGFSVNLRALRHIIMMRTAAGAEWEIRNIFGQVYALLKDKYPLIFHGAKTRMVDGALEVYGMKQQPYELTREQVLAEMSNDELRAYADNRELAS